MLEDLASVMFDEEALKEKCRDYFSSAPYRFDSRKMRYHKILGGKFQREKSLFLSNEEGIICRLPCRKHLRSNRLLQRVW